MSIWVHERQMNGQQIAGAPQLALPINVIDDGEIRLYKIVLPYLPPSKNVYDGWQPAWKHSAKRKWVKAVVREAEALAMPQNVRQVGLAATLVFPNRNRRDPQNFVGTLWHWIPDGLQEAGVIDGDHLGKIDFGPALGVKFEYDLRLGVPKAKRARTIIAVTMLVHP